MNDSSMTLAHFSDTHLLSLEGVGLSQFVNKRWIGGVNLVTRRRHHDNEVFRAMVSDLNAQGPDHVLCTGDVTNFSLESEFKFARSEFDRLSVSPDNLTVLPGNHDRYVLEAGPGFQGHFGDLARSDSDFDDATWPVVRLRGPVALIGLSSSRPTGWFMAYGRLGEAQLERLDAVLASSALRGKLRVVALHHPPLGRDAANPIRGLRDRDALLAVLRRHGCELVLHGHMHRDVTNLAEGPIGQIPVRGITSASYRSTSRHSRAAYRIYEVRDDGQGPRLVGEKKRCWDPDTQTFGAA